nr:unnamed protein product [Callosobruchus chinensis]
MFGRRPAEQEAAYDNNSETTRNPEECLQQQSETSETRQRAAQPGYGVRHASSSSMVSK